MCFDSRTTSGAYSAHLLSLASYRHGNTKKTSTTEKQRVGENVNTILFHKMENDNEEAVSTACGANGTGVCLLYVHASLHTLSAVASSHSGKYFLISLWLLLKLSIIVKYSRNGR